MSPKRANLTLHIARKSNEIFGGFIIGKIIDSAIIGVLCFIGLSILKMPYALLVSVFVGVTNVIPFFGPYIGAIPCILLIMLVSPIQGLYFAIFILVLQQFDGNILGPKILGESTGLSSFMVIVAIMIGGGLFSIVGMIVGVPLCAVIYAFIWTFMNHRLRKKELPDDASEYCNIDCYDAQSKEPVPMPAKVVKERKKITKETLQDSSVYRHYNKARPFIKMAHECVKKYSVILYHFTIETWVLHFEIMKDNLMNMCKWCKEKIDMVKKFHYFHSNRIYREKLKKKYERKRKQ